MAKTKISKGRKISFRDIEIGDDIAVYDLTPRKHGRTTTVDKSLRARGTVARIERIGGIVVAVDNFGDTLASSLVVGMQKIERLN